MPGTEHIRPVASHAPSEPDALTDGELLAVFHDDSADLSLLTQDEQHRLLSLTEHLPTEDEVSVLGHKLPLPESVSRPIAAWGRSGPGRVKEGLSDLAEGEYSRGAHNILMGGATTAAPMLAPRLVGALVKAPVSTLATGAAGATGGLVGGTVARGAARALGASDDQTDVAGDVGGVLGGSAGIKAAQVAGRLASQVAGAVPAGERAKVAGDVVKGVASDIFPRTARVVKRGAAAIEKANAPIQPSEPVPAASPVSSSPAARPPAPPADVPPAAAASPAAPTPRPQGPLLAGDGTHVPASERTRGQMSPAAIGNDLALSARRQGVTLDEDGFSQAAEVMQSRGLSPMQAVREVASRATAPAAPKPPSLRVTKDEATEYARMLAAGKTDAEAADAILAQRRLKVAVPGTKSPRQARQRVAARNASGRWPS